MKLAELNGIPPDNRSNKASDLLYDNDLYVGVEFEIEGFPKFLSEFFQTPFWTVTNDGSLRNSGLEFVTNYTGNFQGALKAGQKHNPLRGEDLVSALRYLDEYIKWYEAKYDKVDVSNRTSTHVHIDVREMEVDELIMYIFLYIVFEQAFYEMVGKGREYNVHCKPFFNNDQTKELLAKIVSSKKQQEVYLYFSKLPKYDGVNINAVMNYGTLEFRIHQGSKAPLEVIPWINILARMKEVSKAKKVHLGDFPEHVSGEGFDVFIKEVFGPLTHIIAPYLDQATVLSGLRQVQEILRYSQVQSLHQGFTHQGGGKKAGNDSIVHLWAKAHNREVINIEE